MKSYGYTTCNDNGKFEVQWSEDKTFFTKLFRIPTEFRYWTSSKEIKTNKYLSSNVGLYYEWFDMEGNQVSCIKTLQKISDVVNMSTFNNY
ncbi:hypothetical protein VP14_213 [Vibrio phage VPMCC14]|nr:hypothetical protein VP14_213 [Vibrio phage VPMCC14]